MEGLIPFVYKAIMQYKNGNQSPLSSWLADSPSTSYMRLPGDSGRFQASEIRLFGSDYAFPTSSTSSNMSSQSPVVCRLPSRRMVT
ncbi:hypothetical protein K2173_001710 [Erythroxylum novogranatense]|uniref:Legume-specific protein n=1 Tax=Erythroxylum novogranatense TaxID=1862640 RepID=A0AAV8S4Z6_9ROSI|nr:hypothetical protein K2173_008891 [Erythroxylum novogranatense]KAJ8747153.1 hypothetical protein K2173_001710 [Erythroxylum novogranatense]